MRFSVLCSHGLQHDVRVLPELFGPEYRQMMNPKLQGDFEGERLVGLQHIRWCKRLWSLDDFLGNGSAKLFLPFWRQAQRGLYLMLMEVTMSQYKTGRPHKLSHQDSMYDPVVSRIPCTVRGLLAGG